MKKTTRKTITARAGAAGDENPFGVPGAGAVRRHGVLTLALPRGRIREEAMALFAKAGIDLSVVAESKAGRRLIIPVEKEKLRVLIVRDTDVPAYVEYGAADVGIAGRDVLEEQGRDLYEPLDLGIGRCRMVVAEPEQAPVDESAHIHLRYATKFPEITRRHLQARGTVAEIIKLYGSIEIAPLVGLADRIVDLVSSGETLRQHRLRVVEPIMDVSARLDHEAGDESTQASDNDGLMSSIDVRDELRRDLRRHPRIVHQALFGEPAERQRLIDGVPDFQPFRGKAYTSALWVLDWDHRLPSRALILRLFVFYSDDARRAGLRTFDERQQAIAREDLFPEFDVPDFAGLAADEAYEAEVPAGAAPGKFRLVSEWRREIEPRVGRKAEEIARRSSAFKELASQMRTRPPGLGDLEAAEWSPPAESGHVRWGLDVWYLRSFNGMVGEGTAFLVDLEDERVVSQRDFQFRAQ
jgi:ATP phosphoribosyltransferase